ncbi:hypothetical protein Acr_03g0011610 [Actinidia rufa]|uniref:Death domain-containing protein n=1 Tax=Actinidia rufa TaxID=165716 RepID=A0A7J0EFH8_9ERIC|nr:hypothetical protein Acr_03g0011610 [Actinidia rufa]
MASIEVGGVTSTVVRATSDQIGDRWRQIEPRRTKSETGEDKSRPDDPRSSRIALLCRWYRTPVTNLTLERKFALL